MNAFSIIIAAMYATVTLASPVPKADAEPAANPGEDLCCWPQYTNGAH
ncbi:hypothetical protein PSPO01_09412 [Paraphaeosphaeria sporulosa]